MDRHQGTDINIDWSVLQLQNLLAESHQNSSNTAPPSLTPASACLGPLLKALNWRGELRDVLEAMPHLEDVTALEDVLSILVRLDYTSTAKKCTLLELSAKSFPCLYLTEDEQIYTVLEQQDENEFLVFNAQIQDYELVKSEAFDGTAYVIKPVHTEMQGAELPTNGWFYSMLNKFQKTFFLLLSVTLLINLLNLAIPIYVIAVYDKVVGTKSLMTLAWIAAGMGFVVLLELVLRLKRAQIVSYLGASIEAQLLLKAFQHLMRLPMSVVSSAPVGAQIARLKQFEAIRDVFTGNLAEAFLDIPFLLLFLAAGFVIGGYLGWIPVGLIVFYVVIGFISVPLVKSQIGSAGETKSKARTFLTELMTKHRSIRYTAGREPWTDRYSTLWSEHSAQDFVAQNTTFILQTVTQAAMLIAGLLTLSFGVHDVIEGTLSSGALIALMILIWRLLTPIQTVFMGFHRVGRVMESISQVNYLTQFKPEQTQDASSSFSRRFKGQIEIKNFAFRYTQSSDLALRNINLNIAPGEYVALTGHPGAGKSTLLKVLLGLYPYQLGNILLDGLDLRQIPIHELRHAVGYVPEESTGFYGTIVQNITLAKPDANLKEIETLLAELNLLEKIKRLPNGWETRLKQSEKHYFSEGMLRQLCLARAFIKNPNIYFLDDPTRNLDAPSKTAFLEKLQKIKGNATIVMATHDMASLQLADRIIVLSQGTTVADITPEEFLKASLRKQG